MKRQAIYISQFQHQNPIPNAARLGSVIASGLIRGVDPKTHEFPADMAQQCAYMFANIRATVEAAGATIDAIVKVTFWMEQMNRASINVEWTKMFPDEATRPARQIMLSPMEPHVLVQCDFLAVVSE